MASNPGNIIEETLRTRLLQKHFRGARYGLLLDLGCGIRPYFDLYKPVCDRSIGADMPGTYFAKRNVDLECTVYEIPLAGGSVDAVLLTEVLHDVSEPDRMLKELNRILRPGGMLIMSSPFMVPVCDSHYDHYRYTRHGLQHLLTRNGFAIESVEAVGGLAATTIQLAIKPWLRGWNRLARLLRFPTLYSPFNPFLLVPVYLPQWLYLLCYSVSGSSSMWRRIRAKFEYGCIGYVTVARKP